MKVIHSDEFNKSVKKLKRYKQELAKLEKIINLIQLSHNYSELINNPLCSIYKLERLKHDKSHLFSYRLNNKVIRLIVKPNINQPYDNLAEVTETLLVKITFDHYRDL